MRDGDEYVINGQKIYTSLAGDADYIWLATRTDPEAAKHKGISIFIVPMDTPGIKVVPMHLLGDHNINYTFYEDVRVPAANLVGGENNGWSLITNQLNHERVTLCAPGIIERAFTDVRRWAQDTKLADGRRVIDQEWVQIHLARVYSRLEFLRLINWKVAWSATQGRLDVADASTIKVFGTEFYMEAFRLLMEVVGPTPPCPRAAPRRCWPAGWRCTPGASSSSPSGAAPTRSSAISSPSSASACRGRCGRRRPMDFSFNEEQEAVRELADRIFTDLSTHERLRELEAEPEGDRFDRRLWSELASAGLLGIGLPEDVGGAGLGFLETALVVEAAGRTAAAVPVIETLAAAAPAIATFGTDEQRQRWLPGVGAGDVVLSTALVELGGRPEEPSVVAERVGEGWQLTGTKDCIPSGMVADAVLVPARLEPDGVGVFIVDPTAAGATRQRQDANTGRPMAVLTLSGTDVDAGSLLGKPEDGSAIVDWLVQRTTAAIAVAEAGAVTAAVALVADYTKTREQFGKPIATFQAVGQRAADAYVDAEAIRLTAWQAAWRIAEGLPADKEVAVAKFWAADGGQRVVHAAVHLHGGVGVDRDYPLHRYFLLTKYWELTLGGATEQLLELGATLAAEPV